MRILLVPLLVTLAQCSIDHKVSGNTTGRIDVVHQIDMTNALAYFKDKCINELTNPTNQEIEDCATDKLYEFIDAIGSPKVFKDVRLEPKK